jgi:hypothetical protein
MPQSSSTSTDQVSARVALHRTKVAASGSRRVEVTVPNKDAALVKSIAESLRFGGKRAELIRESLKPIVTTTKARNGAELVAFFRSSPLAEEQLDISRDRSSGRTVELP